MKKRNLSILAIMLAVLMLVSVFASCKKHAPSTPQAGTQAPTNDTPTEGQTPPDETESEGSTNNGPDESGSVGGTENGTENNTEKDTDGNGNDETNKETAPIPSDGTLEIVEVSNDYKNAVTTYYTSYKKNSVTINNKNMSLQYGINSYYRNMQIESLTTPSGNPYITNSLDVVLNMADGKQFSASKSLNNAMLNIYRYGYYYFENRIEGQTFKNDLIIENELAIDMSSVYSKNGLKGPEKTDSGTYEFKRTGSDPWIRFNMPTVNAEDYDFVEIKMKQSYFDSNSELYIIAGNVTGFTASHCYSFAPVESDDFVTYLIPLEEFECYYGEMKAMRLDVNVPVKSTFEIASVKLLKANYNNAPEDLTIQRSFITYSDKLHHVVQFSTPTEITGVKNVQIVTKIDSSTVEKFIVLDRKGAKTDLDKVLWQVVEGAAFDIKGAGIFGYILPAGESGTLNVALEDGYYVITHTKEINNGTFIPSTEGSRNANDVFMGGRLYTDENHSFDAFIAEAECERNPLEADKNIVIDKSYDSAKFVGYDPLYGYYKFTVKGTGFNQAYFQYPNKQFRVHFTVKGDKHDRIMYFMTYTTAGGLECATLLDGDDMLLPVPLEVCKNFVGDGENTIYNLDDASYGEVYFPLPLKAFESREYTVLNLYQNWGKFPLKQISSIQFFTPYYHLSTGVTETNCIVQLATCGPGLPDHRAMSAPFWTTQPQHNSGGGHNFLSFTDADGNSALSDNTGAVIDSYGPTYCDITLGYESSDGRIVAQYTHTEMPQTDENRAYYEMKYTFAEDVTFKDFAHNFRFYNVTDNDATGVYKRVGYLDENNESQVVSAIDTAGKSQEFVLGKNCPYFSFFDMPDWNKKSTSAQGYTNLSCLIYDYEVIVNGEKIDTNILLINTKDYCRISLNLTEVAFKAGDTITLNAILMPWGSQELDGTYDTYLDKNVRDVRENTLLNPLKATADKDCEVIESVFVPKVRTTNGKSAEFTLTGGHNNIAVRAYGFDKLTAPVIEEFVDGKWVPYTVSSFDTPDDYKNGYYYDGYMVYYDEDGTYSYSFVVEMNNGAARKFRISAEEDFQGWPGEVPSDVTESKPDPINFYIDPEELFNITIGNGMISKAELADDESYVRLFANPGASEAYLNVFNAASEKYSKLQSTGQYVVIKYRLPANPAQKLGALEIFMSSKNTTALGNGDNQYYDLLVYDNEWHVIVFDAAKIWGSHFQINEQGVYKANFLRVDFFGKGIPSNMYIDFAYIGMCDSLKTLCELNSDMDEIMLVTGRASESPIDTATGEAPVIVYVDPESGYTVTETPYAAWTDMVNGVAISKSSAFDKDLAVYKYNGLTIQKSILSITGWTCAEGGIEKYVWSADGGKTWNDIIFSNGRGSCEDGLPAYFESVTKITASKYVIQDEAASKANVRYQGSLSSGANAPGIAADLSAYVGQKVNVTFAAIPKADPDTLCLIIHVTGVEVAPPEEEGGSSGSEEDPNVPYEVYLDAAKIKNLGFSAPTAATVTLMNDDGEYVRYARKGTSFIDGYINVLNNSSKKITGNYFIIKYRTDHMSTSQIWANTIDTTAGTDGTANTTQSMKTDGSWHLMVLDLSKQIGTYVQPNSYGEYAIQWARFDVLNTAASEGYFDIAFIVFCDDPTDVASLLTESDKASCTHIAGNKYRTSETEGYHIPLCALCDADMEEQTHFVSGGVSYDEANKLYTGNCPCGEVITNEFLLKTEAYHESTAHDLSVSKQSEDGEDFLRISGKKTGGDPYTHIYKNGEAITGQYMLIKYRLNNNGTDTELRRAFYASTMSSNSYALGNGDGAFTLGTMKGDGEWHYMIVDLVNPQNTQFSISPDGSYSLKYLRVTFTVQDLGDGKFTSLDIGYIAFADNLKAFADYVEE